MPSTKIHHRRAKNGEWVEAVGRGADLRPRKPYPAKRKPRQSPYTRSAEQWAERLGR